MRRPKRQTIGTRFRPLFLAIILWQSGMMAIAADFRATAPANLAALKEIAHRLPPGDWRELPGRPGKAFITRDQALLISEGDPRAARRLWGWGGPPEIFRAWNGAAFDGRRIYFFGGGHHHYRGNELLAYDLETLGWERLYDPSLVTENTYSGQRRFVPRHGPRSVHTYDGLIYSPETDALYLWTHRNPAPWKFDLALFRETGDAWQAWSPFSWFRDIGRRMYKTARRPDGRILLIANAPGATIAVFDPLTDRYGPVRSGKATISSLVWRDADASAYAATADGLVRYTADGEPQGQVARFPDSFPTDPREAGIAYDPGRDAFAFWPGGGTVWIWQPQNDQWIRHDGRSGPTQPEISRIYSKWLYLPDADIFIGKNADPDQGIWAFKPPASGTMAP